MRWMLACAWLVALLGGSTRVDAAPPIADIVAEGGNHYYHLGEWESGRWLWLRRSGNYVEVEHNDVQAVNTEDSGRWRSDHGRLVLDSEMRFRDIETSEFSIGIGNACGASLLPQAREKLVALQRRPWKPGARLGIDVGWIGHSSLSCWIHIESEGTTNDVELLERMIQSIDAYRKTADHHRFICTAYRYGGHGFLIPAEPPPGRLRLSLPQVMSETDRGRKEGWLPQLVYIEVPREQFESVDSCDFQGTMGQCKDLVYWMHDELRWLFEERKNRSLGWRSLFPGPQPADAAAR